MNQMQEQLNFHYHDCANNYIPTHSTADITTDVTVAPAGEAWHVNYHNRLDGLYNVMLHADDLYHGDINGQYLSSLAIYSTIYQSTVTGLTSLLDISDTDAAYMQAICDTITGGGSSCDDGTCDPGEDQCNCPEDCGAPPTTETNCADGVDEDCDVLTDCDDDDCDDDPACTCLSKGDACTDDSECCSGSCVPAGKCK